MSNIRTLAAACLAIAALGSIALADRADARPIANAAELAGAGLQAEAAQYYREERRYRRRGDGRGLRALGWYPGAGLEQKRRAMSRSGYGYRGDGYGNGRRSYYRGY